MQPASSSGALESALGRARLQVLRATVLIGLLIAVANLAGAALGFTPTGDGVTGSAVAIAVLWCALWALAAAIPEATARCFTRWLTTGLILGALNAMSAALTGGINSPILAVCVYAGWIASVVVRARAAVAISLLLTVSVVVGYVLAGATLSDVLTGPYRYAAVSNALLPFITGLVGVLLAGVANANFRRLPETVAGLGFGAATSPAMGAVLAGRALLALPTSDRLTARAVSILTSAESDVVALLAAGHHPKQIAGLRGVALSTIRSQIKSAKKKTAARTLSELIVIAWDGA